MQVDVLIAGAGPAGCAAALALREAGLSVVLVDRSTLEGTRVGELLPPLAQLFVHEHGLEAYVDTAYLNQVEVIVSWADEHLRGTEETLETWWTLDRARFDRGLLRAAAEAGATALLGRKVGDFHRRGDLWEVEVEGGASVTCRWLVDATGRPATLARKLGARRLAYDRQIALVAFLEGPPGEAPPYMIIEALEDGWWYAAPLGPEHVVAVYLTDADLAKGEPPDLWQEARLAAGYIQRLLANYTLSEDVIRCSANSSHLDVVHGPGWTAVGDAAAAYDPLSSGGLGLALNLGYDGGKAVAAALAGESPALDGYALQVKQAFDDYLPDQRGQYRLVTRWPGSTFWERRHAPLESFSVL